MEKGAGCREDMIKSGGNMKGYQEREQIEGISGAEKGRGI